jgi:hypothetical protein
MYNSILSHSLPSNNKYVFRVMRSWYVKSFMESTTYVKIYRIWGSHSGGYEEHYILGYNAV